MSNDDQQQQKHTVQNLLSSWQNRIGRPPKEKHVQTVSFSTTTFQNKKSQRPRGINKKLTDAIALRLQQQKQSEQMTSQQIQHAPEMDPTSKFYYDAFREFPMPLHIVIIFFVNKMLT